MAGCKSKRLTLTLGQCVPVVPPVVHGVFGDDVTLKKQTLIYISLVRPVHETGAATLLLLAVAATLGSLLLL